MLIILWKNSKNSCNPETTKKSILEELSSYGKKIKESMDIQQCSIVSMLLGKETNGTLPKGSLAEVAENFKLATPQFCACGGKQNSRGPRNIVKENHEKKEKEMGWWGN